MKIPLHIASGRLTSLKGDANLQGYGLILPNYYSKYNHQLRRENIYEKLTRILLTCALIAAMLVSYAVAMAADIGYTGSTTLSMLSDQLFNGVARKKVLMAEQ